MKEFIIAEIRIVEKDIATAKRRVDYLTEELDAISQDLDMALSKQAMHKHDLRRENVEKDREEARTKLSNLCKKLEELRSQI